MGILIRIFALCVLIRATQEPGTKKARDEKSENDSNNVIVATVREHEHLPVPKGPPMVLGPTPPVEAPRAKRARHQSQRGRASTDYSHQQHGSSSSSSGQASSQQYHSGNSQQQHQNSQHQQMRQPTSNSHGASSSHHNFNNPHARHSNDQNGQDSRSLADIIRSMPGVRRYLHAKQRRSTPY